MNLCRVVPILCVLLGLLAAPLRADYLTNTDFKDSLGGWHGDGARVLLLPDGTEGSETDANATPVIKIKLGDEPHGVYQEFEVHGDLPPSANVTIDAYASSDFSRKYHRWQLLGDLYIPDADFWFREMPSYSVDSIDLKPGAWVTLKGTIDFSQGGGGDRIIYFTVPQGSGTVYLKNPHIAP